MARRMPTFFKMGDWNAICDYCAGKFKASQLKQDWRGFMACENDWEPRHPQDFVRGVPDNMTPSWIRPRLAANFVDAGVVNPGTGGGGTGGGGTGGGGTVNHSAVAGIAIGGFAIAGTGTGGTPVSNRAIAGVAITGLAVTGT